MPTYEYQCTRCSHVFEEFKPISAPRRERCPECRGKVELVISGGTGMLFKGSGFYVNDSRGGRAGDAAAPGSTPDAPAADKGKGSGGKAKGDDS
jgi:putative FmdB family regulatory protein